MPCCQKHARKRLGFNLVHVHKLFPFCRPCVDRRVENSELQPLHLLLNQESGTTGLAVCPGRGESLIKAAWQFDSQIIATVKQASLVRRLFRAFPVSTAALRSGPTVMVISHIAQKYKRNAGTTDVLCARRAIQPRSQGRGKPA